MKIEIAVLFIYIYLLQNQLHYLQVVNCQWYMLNNFLKINVLKQPDK